MRFFKPITVVAALLLAQLPALGTELAVLRNGFSIRFERKEQSGNTTRLYTGSGYVDIASDQIASFEAEEAPIVPPPVAAATSPSPAPSAVTLQPAAPVPSVQPVAIAKPAVPMASAANANLDEVAVADAIVREQPLVVLPTRAWWTWLPLQGVARALSQVLTPS